MRPLDPDYLAGTPANVVLHGYISTNGYVTPMVALKLHRARQAVVDGDAWVFPSPRDTKQARSANALCNAWKRIAPAAGIPTGKRFGWHSCRRAFANDLRDVALRDLKDLGGWKSERTIVAVYQLASEVAQRRALERRPSQVSQVSSTPDSCVPGD